MKLLLDLHWPMDAMHGPLAKMMKPKWFIRYTADCTKWDHKQNEEIMEELKAESVLQNTGKLRHNWRYHVNSMDRRRTTQQILQYKPQSKRIYSAWQKWLKIRTDHMV